MNNIINYRIIQGGGGGGGYRFPLTIMYPPYN